MGMYEVVKEYRTKRRAYIRRAKPVLEDGKSIEEFNVTAKGLAFISVMSDKAQEMADIIQKDHGLSMSDLETAEVVAELFGVYLNDLRSKVRAETHG